eukprot:scpid20755/ scgid0179/ Phosphatidylinositol 3,4,5-trisphosphate 5-phosphatase 2; Inositol polyphosphate phosphatase-like protein 1; Protein 51C; SH2 domain-containing inositol 5&apos
MADQVWYHTGLTRVAAEDLLVSNGKDGAFMIRDSDSFSNTLVLCLMYQSRVHHYRIYYRNAKYSVQTVAGVSQVYCDTLQELVSYYGTPGAGLVHHLQYPIQKEVDNESSDDSDTEDSAGPVIKPGIPMHQSSHSVTSAHSASSASSATSAGSFQPVGEPDSDYADIPSFVPTKSARNISKFLEHNFKSVKTNGVDEAFVGKVMSYVTDGALNDLEFVMSRADKPYLLHKLMMESGAEAFSQVQKYSRQLMLLADFFDLCNGTSGSSQFDRELLEAPKSALELSDVMKRLSACQELLSSIDAKATHLMTTVAQQYNTPAGPQKSQSTSSITSVKGSTVEQAVQSFETRTDYQFKSKTILTVDVEAGTLTITRSDKDASVYSWNQIVQIIKSRSAKQKLGIRVEGKARKDFAFNDNKSREVFCQLMQLILKRNSHDHDVSNISVFIGSFNMGDTPCPNDVTSWIKSQGLGKTLDKSVSHYAHDMYVIGTQESGTMGEKDWKSVLYQCTGLEMKMVEQTSLWGIRLVIMVKAEHYNKISHVQTSQVRTGVANTLGNKGAVAVSLHFGTTSMCFICAHLTSGTEKCTRRNNNYRDILRGLQLGQRSLQQFDLTSQFHHVFWLGDLNYRLQCEDEAGATAIVNHIKENNLSVLHEMDQLKREKEKGNVFCSFEEEALDFPPTYRYQRGSRQIYSWRKEKKMSVRINVPSWCDRVLWKSYPRTHLQNTSYGCTSDITTSDHSPVFASFNIGILTQYTAKDGAPSTGTYVHFTYAAAIIGSSSKTAYYLEVHSECLNSSARSVNNTSYLTHDKQSDFRKSCPKVLRHMLHDTSFPEWSSTQLEKMSLQPILADEEYLMHQHFFIAVKSVDGDEVYGGGVVAAVEFFSQSPVEFGIELTRHGKATGYLRGSIYIPVKTTRNPYDDVSLIHEEAEVDSERATSASMISAPPHLAPVPVRPSRSRTATADLRGDEKPSIPARAEDRPPVPVKKAQGSRPSLTDPAINFPHSLDVVSPKSSMAASQPSQSSSSAMSRSSSDERPPLPPPNASSGIGIVSSRHGPAPAPPAGTSSIAPGSSPTHSVLMRSRSAQMAHQNSSHRPRLSTADADLAAPAHSRSHADSSLSPFHNGKQSTVADFLKELGLTRFIDGFLREGWDDLEFLSHMSLGDLRKCGVTSGAHQRQIMDAVKNLQLSK